MVQTEADNKGLQRLSLPRERYWIGGIKEGRIMDLWFHSDQSMIAQAVMTHTPSIETSMLAVLLMNSIEEKESRNFQVFWNSLQKQNIH